MLITKKIKYDKTADADIGNSSGLALKNLVDEKIKFTIDYNDRGTYKPITGEVTLNGKESKDYLKSTLGHDHVRVGVTSGPDDGRDLLQIQYTVIDK